MTQKPSLTCTHQVVPEDRQAEEPGQDGQVGPQAWEGFGEAAISSAEAAEGPHTHYPVGVRTQDVVLTGAQFCGLHQLVLFYFVFWRGGG